MNFTPINGHIWVKPIAEGGVVQREINKYEEKGVVISTGSMMYGDIKVGDKIFFDGWLASKYDADTDDEKWLVKYTDVRGVETQ